MDVLEECKKLPTEMLRIIWKCYRRVYLIRNVERMMDRSVHLLNYRECFPVLKKQRIDHGIYYKSNIHEHLATIYAMRKEFDISLPFPEWAKKIFLRKLGYSIT